MFSRSREKKYGFASKDRKQLSTLQEVGLLSPESASRPGFGGFGAAWRKDLDRPTYSSSTSRSFTGAPYPEKSMLRPPFLTLPRTFLSLRLSHAGPRFFPRPCWLAPWQPVGVTVNGSAP
jgi:hypothetical protein